METDKDKQSVGTFKYNNKLFKGIEQSEIQNAGLVDSEVTSTIRCALHQVTTLVNAHDMLFNNMK